jgi:hypothetical protein
MRKAFCYHAVARQHTQATDKKWCINIIVLKLYDVFADDIIVNFIGIKHSDVRI